MARPKKNSFREPLSRERAFQVAAAKADAEGLEGITMRALAQALGIEAMSLYHYVKNKEALLDGMVDLVFAEIELPDETSTDWKATMRKRARSVREALRRHPWALPLLESRTSPGLATLRHHDAVLGCLRKNGFSLALTGHAYALLDAFIYGFALQELNLPFETPDETQAVTKEMFSQMPQGTFPHLVEYAMKRVMKPGYAFANEFEFGLELVLDGLERQLENSRRAAGKK